VLRFFVETRAIPSVLTTRWIGTEPACNGLIEYILNFCSLNWAKCVNCTCFEWYKWVLQLRRFDMKLYRALLELYIVR